MQQTGGMNGGAHPLIPPARSRGLGLLPVLVIVVAVAVVAVAITVYGPWANQPPTGPNAFAPDSGPVRVLPGSMGCRPMPGDLCYSVSIITLFHTLAVSNLFFALVNASNYSFPESSNVPLGPGASVSVLSSSSVLGMWNFSAGTWNNVSNAVLPFNVGVPIVLDTGLASNATLTGTCFFVQHSSPYGGSVGFFLQYAGVGSAAVLRSL
jgi:hypothetical protein